MQMMTAGCPLKLMVDVLNSGESTIRIDEERPGSRTERRAEKPYLRPRGRLIVR